MAADASPGLLRGWRVVVALAIVLPLSLAAHSWETFMEWWRQSDLFQQRVAAGAAVPYGGAEWRLAGLTKIATRKNGSAVVLAELQAKVTNTEAFGLLPCTVSLTVETGHSWLPVFLSPRELRTTRPDAVDKPTCATAKIQPLKPGDTVEMVETF